MPAEWLGLETSNPVLGREWWDFGSTANAIGVHAAGSEACLDKEVGTIGCDCQRQYVSYSQIWHAFPLGNRKGKQSQKKIHSPLQGTIAVFPAAACAQKPGDIRLGHVLDNGTLYLVPLVTTVVVPPPALAGALVAEAPPAALTGAAGVFFFAGAFWGLAASTLAATRRMTKKKVKNLAMFTSTLVLSGFLWQYVISDGSLVNAPTQQSQPILQVTVVEGMRWTGGNIDLVGRMKQTKKFRQINEGHAFILCV